MMKKLLRIVFLCLLFCQIVNKATAQYAIGGAAGNTLVKSVYWLTWDSGATGSTMISWPSGYNAYNIINGTYVWQFSPTVRITAVISNEVSSANNMQTYTPGEYSDDGLNYMYSGNNQAAPNSRGVANSGLMVVGGLVSFNISISVSILVNGVYVPVNYPGMVIGDAESISSREFISGSTPNPIAWQLLNKHSSGLAGQENYVLTLSNSGTSFKLWVNQPPGNLGMQGVMFAHGAHSVTNLTMQGEGNTALAVGFVLPFDLGDAPLSYGITGNYIDTFQITDTFPGDGTYSVLDFPTTPLVPVSTVYIGANNVDPDGQPSTSVAANSDDTTGVNDEATINPVTLADIKVNQANDVVLTVPVTNGKSVPATLYAWLDFNNDGVFTSDEAVSVTVPPNTTNQNFTLTFPNATFKNKVVAGPLYLRLRIATTFLVDDPTTTVDDRSVSFATDGETEDYKLKNILGVNISGSIYDDGDGGLDNSISGSPVQIVSSRQLYAYLLSNNVIVAQTAVAADGTYKFSNVNNGAYTVAISTYNVAVGGTISAISPNLPSGYVPSGAAYGTNNGAGTGIQSGTPNLQILATTPGTSLDITGLNFALNQAPVATNKTASTAPGQPVNINAVTGDTDADGTVNSTTVLLTDPADGKEKTSVTVANQGTFTVNTATGVVTFTPLASFTGSTTPLAYTIKDNFGTESIPATIKVAIKPVGVPDTATTIVNVPITTNVKANDGTSAANNTVTATSGTHGVTTVDATGKVTYAPVAGYVGKDTYTYTLTAPDGTVSDPITVYVTVNPVGVNDTTSTLVNVPVTINVKSNDGVSATGATVTPTPGAHGTTSVDSQGNVIYTPVANYTGTDTFTYTLTNNGLVSAPITVTVTITPQSASMTLTKVANNTATKAGDVINYTIVAKNTGIVPLSNITITDNGADAGSVSPSSIATLAAGASVTISAKHTVTSADITAGQYSNQASSSGFDPGNNPVKVPGSDDPTTPVANDPTISVFPSSGAISLTKAGVFSVNIITYTFTVKNTGTNNLTKVTLTDAKIGLSAQPVTLTAGILTPGSSANYTATYTLTQADKDAGSVLNNASVSGVDANGNTQTNTASVTVSVPLSPVAKADTAATIVGVPVIIPILKNDNPGNSTLNPATIQIITQPAHGTATVNTDGTVTYTPAAGYTGQDVFTYKVQDAYGYYTNIAPVTVIIAAKGALSLTKSGTVSGNTVVYTFTVKNSGTLAISNIVITDAKLGIANAIVTLPPTGLAAGATATYSSTYTLTQADRDAGTVVNNATATGKDAAGNILAAAATVTLQVPLSPVAANINQVFLGGQPSTIPVAKDGNPGNSTFDPTSIQIVSPPAHGKVVINPDGTVTYIPDPGYTGPDSFTYRLKDVSGYYTNLATVTINDAATVDVKIPNLFTPNGDGINDYFEIRGINGYPNNELIIVNRWGNEVYRQTNYQNKWDGKGLNEGTYYYLLFIRKSDGSVYQVLKGYTTLLRTLKK